VNAYSTHSYSLSFYPRNTISCEVPDKTLHWGMGPQMGRLARFPHGNYLMVAMKMFVIARYVSFPKNRHTTKTNSDGAKPSKTPPTSNDFPRLSLRTPAEDSVTPATPGDASQVDSNLQAEQTAEAMKALAAAQAQMTEPDGAVLHCVAVSYICFKHGRITVPPGVILPCEGFSKPPPTTSDVPFSPTNPPTHWKKAQALRIAPSGNMPAFAKFLKGGWRDVPEGERWWEDALDGPIEEQRKVNLRMLDCIRKGMEATRSIR
jgi:hypothetical protein